MHLFERKTSFMLHQNFCTNFIPEVINIDLWEILHFGMKGTRWVVLELSIILTQNCGMVRYVSEPLHRFTNTSKSEIFHV